MKGVVTRESPSVGEAGRQERRVPRGNWGSRVRRAPRERERTTRVNGPEMRDPYNTQLSDWRVTEARKGVSRGRFRKDVKVEAEGRSRGVLIPRGEESLEGAISLVQHFGEWPSRDTHTRSRINTDLEGRGWRNEKEEQSRGEGGCGPTVVSLLARRSLHEADNHKGPTHTCGSNTDAFSSPIPKFAFISLVSLLSVVRIRKTFISRRIS